MLSTHHLQFYRLKWFLGLLAAAALGCIAAWQPLWSLIGLVAILGVGGLFIVVVKRPFWIILFLTAYIPLETVLLRPLPEGIYAYAQFFGEALIYLTFAAQIGLRILTDKPLRRTPVDVILLAFLLVGLLSMFASQAPVPGSLINLRSLFRYVVLFYLIVNLNLRPKQVRLLLHIIFAIGILQVAIGGVQLLTRGGINDFLIPRVSGIQIAGQTRQFKLVTGGREIGSVFGTLGDPLFFGLFLLLVMAIYLGQLRHLSVFILAFLLLVGGAIAYSYARAAVFGLVLLLGIFYALRYGLGRVYLVALISLPILILGMILIVNQIRQVNQFDSPLRQEQSILENLTGIFSSRYLQIAQKQRLGTLVGIPPTVLANRPLLGYGPDEDTTIQALNESNPSYLVMPARKIGFEDVYWVATLAYYGLIGLSLLALLFIRVAISTYAIAKRANTPLARGIALTAFSLSLLTPFLLFFYRVLEFRVYGFFFWLILALAYQTNARKIAQPAICLNTAT